MKANGVPLPDARLNLFGMRKRTELSLRGNLYERIFCVNCSTPGGAVTKGCPVFYLCDDCVAKHGPPPGSIEVPEAAVR